MHSLQQVIHIQPALYSIWRPAIQRSHETFRTSVSRGHPALKDKPLEFFKRQKHEHREQKQLLKAIPLSNVSALRASFLVANHIVKVKKPFTVGEELILPAAKDICRELLGEAAVHVVAHIPLLAGTITR